ncbi:DUF742 domain-containing protein [Phytohabitans houttuyneae]|uniref:DUF742 domain-containing protein n=1 Tax=Phytohabitans houttuyneae TaxID=1076126 RepID=A0A6V8K0N2_9ACTN|nr:DUF742 domain-containing protein [Phytohabitans houttuyneae]GFJ78672.1 hypothetical protein Phou_028520 [Phytohabitans houttuyneae]
MTHVPPEEPAGPARIRPFLGVSGLGAQPADATPAGLRPFVLTSGRVDGVDPDIGLETQVTARSDGPLRTGVPVSSLAPELRTIMALCAEPISVAEISARARLHLGVTRILVGDLRAAGYLDVHARDAARPDPDTILRVIRGLRAIS